MLASHPSHACGILVLPIFSSKSPFVQYPDYVRAKEHWIIIYLLKNITLVNAYEEVIIAIDSRWQIIRSGIEYSSVSVKDSVSICKEKLGWSALTPFNYQKR